MKRIFCDPRILGGKPVVEGTRMSVEQILGLLAKGLSPEDIVRQFPLLTVEDVRIALDYAAKMLENDLVVEVPVAHSA